MAERSRGQRQGVQETNAEWVLHRPPGDYHINPVNGLILMIPCKISLLNLIGIKFPHEFQRGLDHAIKHGKSGKSSLNVQISSPIANYHCPLKFITLSAVCSLTTFFKLVKMLFLKQYCLFLHRKISNPSKCLSMNISHKRSKECLPDTPV